MKHQANEPVPNHSANIQGSVWHRWEPHIHTPGTVLNDQFTGEDPFEDYLKNVENSNPEIKALGITDYFSLESASLLERSHPTAIYRPELSNPLKQKMLRGLKHPLFLSTQALLLS